MCSRHEQLLHVIGVGPQWATTNVRQKATIVCEVRGSILWSHHVETRELPGERNNARNNARCTKARKNIMHGLDGQHQDVDRTARGRVSQSDRGQG